ncbi:MerR family DNA-binding transcriptional regulator [Pikeienuella sp. HZG-20]|uniref:MerR family transcriptional regulator n=1 Tax=Paludibacillus litoralis TaxID=3133267 RepID=UPI0030EC6ECE
MTDQTYTIGELCAEFGVTPRTLRFYEQRELLKPIREGQRRIFTLRDRARLKLILRGKRFGFSLESIRQWLNLYDLGDGGVTQMTTWVNNAREQMERLRAQRDELEDAMRELQVLIDETETELAGRSARHAAE